MYPAAAAAADGGGGGGTTAPGTPAAAAAAAPGTPTAAATAATAGTATPGAAPTPGVDTSAVPLLVTPTAPALPAGSVGAAGTERVVGVGVAVGVVRMTGVATEAIGATHRSKQYQRNMSTSTQSQRINEPQKITYSFLCFHVRDAEAHPASPDGADVRREGH